MFIYTGREGHSHNTVSIASASSQKRSFRKSASVPRSTVLIKNKIKNVGCLSQLARQLILSIFDFACGIHECKSQIRCVVAFVRVFVRIKKLLLNSQTYKEYIVFLNAHALFVCK